MAPVPVLAAAPAAPDCACLTIPALTPVSIEILAPLGSKTSKSGETFALRLAAPIVINGKEVVPAGTTGMGEVVHAKKAGGSGAPGELVLAARYLDFDGRRIKLRSMHLLAVGKDNRGAAMAASVAVGLFGLLVEGGDSSVAPGQQAQAKTAEAFALPSPTSSGPVPAIPPAGEQAIQPGTGEVK